MNRFFLVVSLGHHRLMVEHTPPRVVIEPWSEDDLALLRQLNAPEMTEHLGGPETDEQVVKRHRRYVENSGIDPGQMYRVVLLLPGREPGREKVGSVGFWGREWQEEEVFEIGWGVLPQFQGRGIAVAAARAAALAAAAAPAVLGRRRYLHAYPEVDNAASNAVCRRAGFELLGDCDFEYPVGHMIRCNDWRLDLTGLS
jgi:RimJ/RimL family protein N-acetyltransferase